MTRQPSPSRVPVRVALAVLALALLALGAFAVTRRATDAEARADRSRQAEQTAMAVETTVAATQAGVGGLVGLFATTRDIDAFSQFAAPVLRNRALDALQWAPRVPADTRTDFERTHGFSVTAVGPGGRLVPADGPDALYPVTYVAPLRANVRSIGVDVASQAPARQALEAAVQAGGGRASAPLELLSGGTGVVLVEPSYRRGAPIGTVEERRAALTGFAIGVLRVDRLVEVALGTDAPAVRITADGRELVRTEGSLAGAVTRDVRLAGRRWQVEVGGPVSSSARLLPSVVLAAGLMLAGLVAALLLQSGRRQAYAERLVAERTVELRDALGQLTALNSDLAAARAEAERHSRTDALTGALNRPYFLEALEGELSRARRQDQTPGLLLLEVDHLRHLQETHGHRAGDKLVSEIAHRLRTTLRGYDSIARWGDSQFAVLTPAIPDEAALWRLGDSLRQVVERGPVALDDGEFWATVSVGAVYAGDDHGGFTLVGEADQALATARRQGRNRTVVVGEVSAEDLTSEKPDAVRIAQALALSSTVREGMPDHHCEDVADFSGLVAEALGLDPETVVRCRVAGWLHDIGKIAIPAEILAKPMSLTADEWRVMRTHAALGADIVARIPALADAEPVVRHHHERFDGTGYPAGLAGTHIPIEARIVAAADTFSAIVSNAPFRRAQNLAAAIEELRRSGGSQLDPEVTEALCRVLESDTPDRRTRQHGRRPAGT